jgi:UDP-GlcNAc:undecaprenyl-phosphate GlcNAc-1-phosphate transferase
VIFYFFIAFAGSLLVALGLALTTRWHSPLSADTSGSGPQKIHTGVVPRVGGVAVFAGFAAAFVVGSRLLGLNSEHTFWLLCALSVSFAAGLYEDLSKNFGPMARLLATFVSAAIAYQWCGASLTRFDVGPLDAVLVAYSPIAFLFTVFCVGAIAHAYNLSDGLNGLLAGLGLVACLGITLVARQYNDTYLLLASMTLGGALVGFGLLNYPRSYLFSGDGGAYLVGTAVAVLSILLIHRHAEISPWLPFCLVLYPFTDTTCAIIRRKLKRVSISAPDAEHLHTLLAKRMTARFGHRGANLASLLIVGAAGAFMWLAATFHAQTTVLIALAAAYFVSYALAYRFALSAAGVTLRLHSRSAGE